MDELRYTGWMDGIHVFFFMLKEKITIHSFFFFLHVEIQQLQFKKYDVLGLLESSSTTVHSLSIFLFSLIPYCICVYVRLFANFFIKINSLSKLRISSSSLKSPAERMLNLPVSRRTPTVSSSRSDVLAIFTLSLSRISPRPLSLDNLSLLVSFLTFVEKKVIIIDLFCYSPSCQGDLNNVSFF